MSDEAHWWGESDEGVEQQRKHVSQRNLPPKGWYRPAANAEDDMVLSSASSLMDNRNHLQIGGFVAEIVDEYTECGIDL